MTGDHDHIDLKVKDKKVSSIDTKSKLILTIIIIIVSIVIITYEQLILIGSLILAILIMYRISFLSVLKKALVPFPLILSLTLLAYFSDLGNNTLNFGGITIEYSNFQIASYFFIRSMLIVLISIGLVESEESFFEVIYALDDLGLPEALVSILLLMYRSALDLYVEARRMIDVRYSRSSYKRWGTNLYTYRILGYMIANILVRSFLKKDKRRDALYSRNFKGKLYHKPKPFLFNGMLLLWLTTIGCLVILLSTDVEFIDIGEKM